MKMVHPDSGAVRDVPGRARSVHEQRGWRVAASVTMPAAYHRKSEWIAYAAAQGVPEPDSFTKRELVAMFEGEDVGTD